METTIKIKPVNYSVETLNIHNIALSLDKTATIICDVRGEKVSISYKVELTADEYAAWGNDDNYVVDLLLGKLGLEKA
jgi:hypothetical protein